MDKKFIKIWLISLVKKEIKIVKPLYLHFNDQNFLKTVNTKYWHRFQVT